MRWESCGITCCVRARITTNPGFLALAGYDAGSYDRLKADLRSQFLPLEAEPAGQPPYGQKFIIRGDLKGPNGRSLRVLSVWMLDPK
jgi:hypothetical protein